MQPIHTIQGDYNSSWLAKFVECSFAGFAVVNVFATLMEVMPDNLSFQSGNPIVNSINMALILLAILFALIFPVYWKVKERKSQINSEFLHTLLRGILRYWIAFEVMRYGLAKIFQTQFPVVYSRNDSIVGHLNGFDLTWSYFGHSYVLAVIIGSLQIVGAVLLLFRRTTTLGIFILLPILFNIVLIDIFFDIAWGALMNSVAFTLGLSYLLSLRWNELKALFLRPVTQIPTLLPTGIKYLVRLAVIIIPLAIILYFTTFNSHATFAGKWQVTQMIRKGDTLQNDAWLVDSAAWKNVYIEQYGMLAMCSNPYTYLASKSKWARYDYDSNSHTMQLVFPEKLKNDTMNLLVTFPDKKHMKWKSIDNTASLSLVLSRQD
jgi:hypothetical protein